MNGRFLMFNTTANEIYHDLDLVFMGADELTATLRGDPAFTRILGRVHLPSGCTQVTGATGTSVEVRVLMSVTRVPPVPTALTEEQLDNQPVAWGLPVPTEQPDKQHLFMVQLVRDIQQAQWKHISIQDQVTYLLERYSITPKETK